MVDTDLSVGSGNASEMNDEQLLILASLATLLDYVMAEAHWLYNDKQPEKHTKLPWINVKNLRGHAMTKKRLTSAPPQLPSPISDRIGFP
jgi:hypothetical protein